MAPKALGLANKLADMASKKAAKLPVDPYAPVGDESEEYNPQAEPAAKADPAPEGESYEAPSQLVQGKVFDRYGKEVVPPRMGTDLDPTLRRKARESLSKLGQK